jgi:hypothetical protein
MDDPVSGTFETPSVVGYKFDCQHCNGLHYRGCLQHGNCKYFASHSQGNVTHTLHQSSLFR